jgi:hypothetical protein
MVLSASLLFAQMNKPLESQVSGLVAAYSFDEGTGTSFADASGNNNTGTVSGAVWAAGRSGSALSFDGINDIATVPDSGSLDVSAGLTLEAWVYLVARNGWRTILMKERPGHLVYGLYANTDTNRPSGEISTAGGVRDVRGTAQLPVSVWTHVAVTHDGSMLRLFVNGVQVQTRAVSGTIAVSGNPLRIGGNSIWGEYFSGRIDDVRVYNRAISTAQVQADMNTPVSQPPPPAPPDTTAPTVTITSPAAGSTVAATVTITAGASDNAGVSGVQFLLDGSPLGAEDTSNPYSVSWNTATVSNAAHRLSARARDAAGNTGVAPDVTVTVANPPKLIITTPSQGASISGSTVGVAYTTAGDLTGVGHAHFRLDTNPEVMDMTLDGTYAFNNVAPGSHVLNGHLVRADHSKISGTDAAPVSFATVTPDTTPPAVSITAPLPGSSVSGVVTVTASASDDVGVAGVQFQIDGSNLGLPDTLAPYAASWQSTSVANGSHTLSAIAYDAANNQTSTSAVVTVANVDPAAERGRWSAVMNWPLVAVHSTLLHTGEVLVWDGWEIPAATSKLWNPVTNTFTSVPAQSAVFCASHSQLADGRLLVVGGHNGGEVGIRDVNMFDPRTRAWTYPPDMSFARWYPSSTTLGDGRVLVVSGQITPGVWADTPEIYDPATNAWTSIPQINNSDMHDSEYPLSFLLPDGRVAVVTPNPGKVRLLDPARLTSVDPGSHPSLLKSTVAMYRPGRLLATGGGNSSLTNNAQTTASVIDFGQPSPAWRAVAPMAYPRYSHNLVVLADGSVLAVGGSTDLSLTSQTGTLAPELWDPATETWHTMASMQHRRNYHSTALLLPDGRVLVAGGGRLPPATDFLSAEIFSPPYLFKGPRPVIAAAPAVIPQIGTVVVETLQALDIASVSLIRPGSVTHTLDMDQRYLPLQFSAEAGRLLVSGPGNPALAPPGYYMLVIVDKQGVPSTASFVRVPSPSEDTEPPSAPSNLMASGAVGTASLSWQAATDNQGVSAYNVHRSIQQGFTPSGATLAGRTGSLTFSETGVSGTYFYRVTAEDMAGNVGAPSNEARADIAPDTVPPSVTLTQPPSGSTVSGLTTISAGASDDIGVAGVQFLLDGVLLGTEDVTAPYSVVWSTTSVANGSHALSARARDAAGNQTTSDPIPVTVSNTASPGLVASFGFNEGSGATVLDSSGKSNNGTIANATWTAAGKFGSALSFNGASSWVTVPDATSLDLTNGLTLEAWVRPSTLSGWRTALLKESAGGLSYALYAHNNTPNPAVTVQIGGGDRSAEGTSPLPLNTWTHLAATYDGAQLRLYVNGVQAGSRAQTGNIAVSAAPLRVGGNAVWTEFFAGLIDEVRVYNRALSPAEIQADMNAPVK